jgi:hypothetical protein
MNGMEILIPITMFIAFVAIVKIISDNRVKKMLIERGKVDENIKFLYQTPYWSTPLSSLKWGFVLVGIGLAFLLGQLFPYSVSDEAVIGLMFLFAGVGFLLYYFMAKDRSQESR